MKHLITILLAACILAGCGKDSATGDDGISMGEQELIVEALAKHSDAWSEQGEIYSILATAYDAQATFWSFWPYGNAKKRDRVRLFVARANEERIAARDSARAYSKQASLAETDVMVVERHLAGAQAYSDYAWDVSAATADSATQAIRFDTVISGDCIGHDHRHLCGAARARRIAGYQRDQADRDRIEGDRHRRLGESVIARGRRENNQHFINLGEAEIRIANRYYVRADQRDEFAVLADNLAAARDSVAPAWDAASTAWAEAAAAWDAVK